MHLLRSGNDKESSLLIYPRAGYVYLSKGDDPNDAPMGKEGRIFPKLSFLAYDCPMPRDTSTPHHLTDPLHIVFGEMAGLWIFANIGYFFIFPALGLGLSYNTAPVAIAVYFFVWAGVTLFYFWDLFALWLSGATKIWLYVALSLGCGALIWTLLYAFSFLPALSGLQLAPSTDILFASPWYFLPKSAEVLMQQLLITVLVLELSFRLHSLKKVIIGFAICFGGAHILLFLSDGAVTAYAAVMTAGSLLSALVFPYLIMRVRGGFVYSYTIHLLFYIFLAMLLHAWPPPNYFA